MPEPKKLTLSDLDDPQHRITPLQQAAASCTGAIITSFLVTPLDVVKTRLQAQQKQPQSKCFLYCNGLMDHLCGCNPKDLIKGSKQWYQRPGHFNGTLDAFIKIGRNEGVTSLWSGLSPTLVLAIPATILYFVSYEQLRLKLKDMYNRNKNYDPPEQPYWIPLCSGGFARVFATTCVSPLELIRTKMQSQRLSYLEVGQALKILVNQSGVFGLWKGVMPTLLRDVPFSAIYWVHYETIKSFFCEANEIPSVWLSFFSGMVSGAVAAAATVPFDVVKTHQQIEFGEKLIYTDTPKRVNSMLGTLKSIYSTNGTRGLFAGLTPRLIKVAPACAIMISSFEYSKVFFNSVKDKDVWITHGALRKEVY